MRTNPSIHFTLTTIHIQIKHTREKAYSTCFHYIYTLTHMWRKKKRTCSINYTAEEEVQLIRTQLTQNSFIHSTRQAKEKIQDFTCRHTHWLRQKRGAYMWKIQVILQTLNLLTIGVFVQHPRNLLNPPL